MRWDDGILPGTILHQGQAFEVLETSGGSVPDHAA